MSGKFGSDLPSVQLVIFGQIQTSRLAIVKLILKLFLVCFCITVYFGEHKVFMFKTNVVYLAKMYKISIPNSQAYCLSAF